MISEYQSIKYFAEMWNLNPRTVRMMCANGRIKDAVKLGRDWMIPIDAERPHDNRISSGVYVDWRNTKNNKQE